MSYTSFIPKLWAARLKDQLEENHIATAFVNRDYEGEIKNQGDTVHVNSLGPVTIKKYDATAKENGIDAPEKLSTTDQTLVIDQGDYFNFEVLNFPADHPARRHKKLRYEGSRRGSDDQLAGRGQILD